MILKAITAELHRFDGALNWNNPIRVRFEFQDALPVRIKVASDGETVIVDHAPLEPPFDMEEYGSIEHADAGKRIAANVIGADVVLRPIANPDGSRIGLALVWEGEPVFCVLNMGDDLYWGDWKRFESWEDVGPILPEAVVPGQ